MSELSPTSTAAARRQLAELLLAAPSGRRAALLQQVVACRAEGDLEASFNMGPIRAAFAAFWERRYATAVPIRQLRRVLDPPVPIKTVLLFSRLTTALELLEIEQDLMELAAHVYERIEQECGAQQRTLFDVDPPPGTVFPRTCSGAKRVTSLHDLLGNTYPTILADPPWAYDNEASRGAAVNHYPTLSVEEICREPVAQLAAPDAHLHLWTTNGFLQQAFDVMDAWGFTFKSCLVWVKDELGMGNYWRVSHEFLLLGVRGRLTFRDRTLPSWVLAHRGAHSRKPGIVRELVERVSPGPYLELYGREELPDSEWTVYGNAVERRLC
jgi:N6-adenosine-specific RNA methylase IME4